MQNTSMQTIASLPECILLDGGLGHEWKRQSGDESFLGGCLACTRQPEGVSAVHAAFFDAADAGGWRGRCCATTNSFVATPHHVGDDAVALARAAVRCARSAAAGGPRRVVAGSLPPLGECYAARGARAGDADAYAALAAALADEGVDALLAETLSSSAEAVAAVEGVARARVPTPLWCCVTLADDATARLRGGEPLAGALAAIVAAARASGARLEGLGVNCCAPVAVDAALPTLVAAARDGGGLRVIVYANAFAGTTSAWLASVGRPDCRAGPDAPADVADYAGGVLTAGAYAAKCRAWRAAGATVVGGCCGVSPDHMRAVAAALRDG